MKTYFVCADYWCPDGMFNKFFFGIIDADLKHQKLTDVIKLAIEKATPGIINEKTVVKVTALNNIDV